MFRLATPGATRTCAQRSFSTTANRAYARCQLVGNLGSAPQLSATAAGRESVRYTLAVRASQNDPTKVHWFRVTSFAEGAQKEYMLNVPKGCVLYYRLLIEVTQKGKTATVINIVQRHMEVLRRKQPQEAQTATSTEQTEQTATQEA
ncbi:ssDNA-binding protein, mitochondrial [Ascosphaera acerosa]|nr:ssDNA-binding protein, mitochondrial [Ascosphaera acerosa]